MAEQEAIHVYTDGGCQGNGKKSNVGGYGVVLKWKGRTREMSRGFADTTNNRMEMQAAIDGLDAVLSIPGYADSPKPVILYSDSGYMLEGLIKKWYVGWQRKNWKTSSGSKAKNIEHWKELIRIVGEFEAHGVQLSFEQVKGHSGHPENERCDELATQAMADILLVPRSERPAG